MKKVIALSLFVLTFCISGWAQYTPLPKLDENVYAHLVEQLRTEATLQDIPELKTMADNMSYEGARRFLANPHVFMNELKSEENGQQVKPAMSKAVFGIIVAILMNTLNGLDNYSSAQAKIGFALGFYAMWSLAKVYFITELLFQYSMFGEKATGTYSAEWRYKMGFITVFAACLYAIEIQNIKLLLGLGPTLAFVVSGKETYKDSNGEDTYNFGFGSDDWRRFYAGISIVAGIMTARNLLIYLSYTFPFTKLHGGWDAKLGFFKLCFGIPLPHK